MARRIRDLNLESRDARSKLKVSGKPYWRAIGLGFHLGYRKGVSGGRWVVRRYLGKQSYQVETIAIADDLIDADGAGVLTFWQAQEKARVIRAPKETPFTVADAISLYLDHMENQSSQNAVSGRLKAYVLPAFGETPVADLTSDAIRKWHRDISIQPARQRTGHGAPQNYRPTIGEEGQRRRKVSANNVLAHFKAALNFVWKERKVTCERSWERVTPFVGVSLPRSRYLTLAECQRLINASEGDFRVLVRAALETGARYMELARLRVADFNPDSGTIHIRKSKAGKDRHIVLTEDGQAFMAGLAAGRAGSALLLGKEWRPALQARPMSVACIRAKIDPPISFHGLRHTWSSLSVMNGTPLMVVARNLGHSDTRMVEKHYGHLAKSYVADEIRKGAPRFGMATAGNVVGIK